MRMFDEEEFDSQGRTVGGQRKTLCLWSNDFAKMEFTDSALQRLIRHLGRCWDTYHCARTDGVAILESPEKQEAALQLLKLAPLPHYWAEQFATALCPSVPKLHIGHNLRAQSPDVHESRSKTEQERGQVSDAVFIADRLVVSTSAQEKHEGATRGGERGRKRGYDAMTGESIPGPRAHQMRRSKRMRGIDKVHDASN